MRYALDTEFIDTPSCSALISLGIVGEDGRCKYFQFNYPRHEITPWLEKNVIANLNPRLPTVIFSEAADGLIELMDGTKPQIWAYYGAYDWYWFCRIFGGLMNIPRQFENRYYEWKDKEWGPLKNTSGIPHNALNDARSLMQAMKQMDEDRKRIHEQNDANTGGRE